MERSGMVAAILVPLILLSALVFALHMNGKHKRRLAGEEARRQAVLAHGVPAVAQVLEQTDTGRRLGADEYFILSLRLDVLPEAGMEPFQSELTLPVSPARLSYFAEGKLIKVRIDAATRELAVEERTK